jgi:hypothetical protein
VSGFSLHNTAPVYRRFLAGGPETLRLSLPAAAVVVIGGLIPVGITGAASIFGGVPGSVSWWPSAVAATLTAWLLAALAARWLGSRLGALAGLVQLSTGHVLLPRWGTGADMLFCAAVLAAMGTFALANVPGRLPLVEHRWTRWGFYAATGLSFVWAGPIGPALIVTGCLLFLILCADGRGVRFFASPLGIAIFALMVAVRLAQPGDPPDVWVASCSVEGETLGLPISLPESLCWLAWTGLPWTPLVVLTVAVGLRQGHYATPIWRFFGCWAAAALMVAAAGGFRDQAQLSPILPPLAVTSAAGLGGLLIWCRLGRRRGFRAARTTTARP